MSLRSFTPSEIAVEISTCEGIIFSGFACAISLRTIDGSMDVTCEGDSFLNLSGLSELTIQTPDGAHKFLLEDAAACVRSGHLTVLAKKVTVPMQI